MATIEYIARALVRRGDSFLLCRDIKHGHAYLPGGHVEFGESASEAALRELKEECNLDGIVSTPLLLWESRFIQNGKAKHEITAVFHVEHPDKGVWPKIVLSLESHIRFEWIPYSDVKCASIVPVEIASWLATKPTPASPLKWLSINELG